MKIGINQPNFFSWLGYFDLLDTVDVFVVLDNVLFGNKPKRINRNFIVNRNGDLVPLTLSIKHNSKTSLINECTIIKDKNYLSHINIIKENYRVAPYYNEVISLVEEIYDFPSNILSEFNTNLIQKIFFIIFNKEVKIKIASQDFSNKDNDNESYFIKISNSLNCTEYFTFQNGFKNKLYDPNNFQKKNISFYYQSYIHPEYQKKNFIKFASVLDLLFYDLPNSSTIIRSGRNWIKV
tara:strand:- start:1152 stop:1862 length:711 start_codon:yes stop_codon:yes gene_type:complete